MRGLTRRSLLHSRLFTNAVRLPSFPSSSIPVPDPAWAPPNPKTPSDDCFSALIQLLKDPTLSPGPSLHSALDRTGIRPDPATLSSLFDRFDSSPKIIRSLFQWAETRPDCRPGPTLVNAAVDALGKAREFDSAWSLILERVPPSGSVSLDTFAILIRRYSRAGMTRPAIRTFEYASNLEIISDSGGGMRLFEILLDSLCKEGHVKIVAEYFDKKKGLDPSWVPSIRVYNILLNGWFRSRKVKHAENLWLGIKGEKGLMVPDVVTYGTLVEGYCRMGWVERAIELVHEMRKGGIEPNNKVYNPIIDALAEAGRFKEVSGMMERFMLCDPGPNLSTYNSLVKGYCKAGDVSGASEVLKTMINRDIYPTIGTYNYLFRCYSRLGKVEDGMNLYTKLVELGYVPDRLTYHLLVKMLCEEERSELVIQVAGEMRDRGFDMDLDTGTMLIHLFCKMGKHEDAFSLFQDMLRRGIIPQYLTFCRLNEDLRKHGMFVMARKLCDMMACVPRSTGLPNTYLGENSDLQRARRRSILKKAEAMSEMLKTCNDPKELLRRSCSVQDPVSTANRLIREFEARLSDSQNSEMHDRHDSNS